MTQFSQLSSAIGFTLTDTQERAFEALEAVRRNQLQLQLLNSTTVLHNGGTFYVTPELIGMLGATVDASRRLNFRPLGGLHLVDAHGVPVMVNAEELLTVALEAYAAATAKYSQSYVNVEQILKKA